MARLGSDLKMGFYPTPSGALEEIPRFLDADGNEEHYLLDPCCGEGEALHSIASNLWHIKTYGVEQDGERAVSASNLLDHVVQGSIFDARINPLGSIGLLYLNPPYGHDDGERVEMRFLKHSFKWLCEGGVLVFIVPEHIFERNRDTDWISAHFRDVNIYRFPCNEFPRFKQVVFFGVKREGRGCGSIPPPPYPHLEDVDHDESALYRIPPTEGPEVVQGGKEITPEDIEKFSPRLLDEVRKLMGSEENLKLKPLLPLRKGHLIALLTAGILDGKIETQEGFILVRGFSDRVISTWVDEESNKEITRNTYSVGIRVMEEGGAWYDIR